MSAVGEAAQQLRQVVADVDGVRVHTDPAAVLDPPAVVIGPPALNWTTYCIEPNEAVFPVIVVVRPDSRAMERLWELVPAVSEALQSLHNVAVNTAAPRTWGYGDNEFPAYEIPAAVTLPL